MRKSYVFLLITAVIFTVANLSSAVAGDGEKRILKFNPKAGTSAEMVMDYTMDMTMEMMGQEMKMDQTLEMGALMDVVENNGSSVKTEMTYTYFAMEMDNAMTGKMAYDSRKSDNEGMMASTMDAAFKDVLNKSITITQDMSGKTIKSEGMDDIMGMESSKGGMDFKSIMGMSQFPDKALAIGDSWSNTFADASSPMKIDVTMTLTDIKAGKVYVEFESVVSDNDKFDMSEAMPDSEEEAPELGVSGTQNGTFVYEEGSMWLIEGMIKQDLEMEVEQMGMKIPMKIKGDMIISMQ